MPGKKKNWNESLGNRNACGSPPLGYFILMESESGLLQDASTCSGPLVYLKPK